MFKRSEEVIVLVLALLWVVLTWFAAAYTGADSYTVIEITLFTFVWAAVCFRLWQLEQSRHIWPLFLGFLVACWWPLLDWFAVKDLAMPDTADKTIVLAKPWYAGWTFKLVLAFAPVCAGYIFKWKRAAERKKAA